MTGAPEDFPIIETERLILRDMRLEDAEALFAYASDPEVACHLTWDSHRSIEDSEKFLKIALRGYATGELHRWAVIYKEDGVFIGTCGLVALSPEHYRAHIGYALSRDYWGRGLTTEAVRAVVSFGFEKMDLNKIVARCFPENTASERVMQKVGMSYEGTFREHLYVRGRYRDLKVYSVLRREYQTR